MAQDQSTMHYLELSSDPVRFEAVNQLTNVFFDDSNKDVFAVRSGGVMGVVVKGPNGNKPLNFRMEDRGTVLSIKFSLDHKILAVQRLSNSIELMNFSGETLDSEYSVSCKKNSNILGFVWSHLNELAIVTDHGIELYTVIPAKKSLKQLKTMSATVQWFVWCPVNKIALLASAHGSQLQPVIIKPGSTTKLAKVDTEQGRMSLERDVTISTLYGIPAVLILRHQSGPQTAEVHVHLLNGPGQAPVKSHVLKLGLSGRFAINIVDDLILVHHQASRSSQVFDIALPGESDGTVKYHVAIAPAKSFKTTAIILPGIVEPQAHIYSPNWVVFQPDIVIDAKLGCLWHIDICLAELCTQIRDLSLCTQVALKRTNGKTVLLDLLLSTISQPKPPLDKLQESFNHINFVYRDWAENELQSQLASLPSAPLTNTKLVQPRVLIDQNCMFEEIFQKINTENDLRKTEWILISYMSSLSEFGITAQHNMNKLLVMTLAKQQKFTALQQMVQYGVISDSKPLAVFLLSLGNMHPSTTQLALDMLSRLDAREEIQEVLLSENQVLAALKLAQDNAQPRKFLNAAQNADDDNLLHSVLYYFLNNPQFSVKLKKEERLISYINEYNARFGNYNT
ncbi:regulator of MON1-CCZ1 complex protein bulli isoform X2 [Rhynchophorus ferrugineus]|uniref:regulator of MON1-CCZ1 complex protein bulli isoform X2 n=1 Tax=Rhynchophorus ferrugineus TaxID=354439 RepID=UPI003FCE8AB8